MGQHPSRDVAAHRIRERLSHVRDEIDDEITARDVAFTYDYEYRMSDARLRALRTQKEELKEILGDL
jgi:hypothetical protein